MSAGVRLPLATDEAEVDRVLDEGLDDIGAKAPTPNLMRITGAGRDEAGPGRHAGGAEFIADPSDRAEGDEILEDAADDEGFIMIRGQELALRIVVVTKGDARTQPEVVKVNAPDKSKWQDTIG